MSRSVSRSWPWSVRAACGREPGCPRSHARRRPGRRRQHPSRTPTEPSSRTASSRPAAGELLARRFLAALEGQTEALRADWPEERQQTAVEMLNELADAGREAPAAAAQVRLVDSVRRPPTPAPWKAC